MPNELIIEQIDGEIKLVWTYTTAEPDPLDQHTITVEGTELDVDFNLITYEDGHSEDTITVEGTEVLVDFIHTDDIVT